MKGRKEGRRTGREEDCQLMEHVLQYVPSALPAASHSLVQRQEHMHWQQAACFRVHPRPA